MSQLHLAASNIGWAASDDPDILALMQQLGYTGLEAAPTRLVGEFPYTKLEQAAARKPSVLDNLKKAEKPEKAAPAPKRAEPEAAL